MYVIVFVLLLWVLFNLIQCKEGCIVDDPKPNVLYIMQTKCGDRQSLEFQMRLKSLLKYYDPNHVYPEPEILCNCSPNLKKIMANTNTLRYVIHLNVTDFYQNNYNEFLMNGFQWAGNITSIKKQACWMNQITNEVDETDTCENQKNIAPMKVRRGVPTSIPVLNIVHIKADFHKDQCITYKNDTKWTDDIGKGTNNFPCIIKEIKRKTDCGNQIEYEIPGVVKLVSKDVTKIPFLFDFIHKFKARSWPYNDYKIPEVNYKILICSKTNPEYMPDIDIKRLFNDGIKGITYLNDTCKQVLTDNVIAVLVPSPGWTIETDIPVIFYEASFFPPEATTPYNNSMIKMEAYSYALLEFIKKVGWQRVAIVSDGWMESLAYEEWLRKLFYEEELAHEVMTLTETYRNGSSFGYNFSEVLQTLKHDEIKIIIANIDESNAVLLAKEARRFKMTIRQRVLWITRDLSKSIAKRVAKNLGTIFSLSRRKPLEGYVQAINSVFNQIYLNQKNSKKQYDFLNHRKFAADIEDELRSKYHDASIDIERTTAPPYGKELFQMIASYHDKKLTFYKHPSVPKDRKDTCSLKTSNYYRPCNDIEFVYLMLVIIVTTVTTLGITYFFHQTPDTPCKQM